MTDRSERTSATLVRGLGGVSIGLGLSELIAPSKVADLSGINGTRRTRTVIRALGLRECGHAVAVLFGSGDLVWTRVAGDLLDLTLLSAALAGSDHRARRQRGTASALGLAVVGAVDFYTAWRTTRGSGRHAYGPPHQSLQ